MDIAKIAQEKIELMVQEGAIEKMVETNIRKSVESIVNDMFRSYGDWSKKIEEALKQKLEINLDNLDIKSYNAMVVSTIEGCLTDTIAKDSLELVKSKVTAILGIPVQKEWKLSDICKLYWQEVYNKESKILHLKISESEYGSRHIYIGYKDTGRYTNSETTEIRIHVNTKDNTVYAASTQNYGSTNPLKDRVYKGKLEAVLMTLWAHDCVLNIDVEDADDIDIPEEYED